MKVTVCQLDNRCDVLDTSLRTLAEHVVREGTEFLLLPEMCFAEWLAAEPKVDPSRWQAAADAHLRRIEALPDLGVPAVIGTRPVGEQADTRRNQAWLWCEGEVLA